MISAFCTITVINFNSVLAFSLDAIELKNYIDEISTKYMLNY